MSNPNVLTESLYQSKIIPLEATAMGTLDRNVTYELRTYSGYKGEERPQSLVAGEKEWRIEKILSRERKIDLRSGRQFDEFECRVGSEGVKIRIYPSGKWTMSFSE